MFAMSRMPTVLGSWAMNLLALFQLLYFYVANVLTSHLFLPQVLQQLITKIRGIVTRPANPDEPVVLDSELGALVGSAYQKRLLMESFQVRYKLPLNIRQAGRLRRHIAKLLRHLAKGMEGVTISSITTQVSQQASRYTAPPLSTASRARSIALATDSCSPANAVKRKRIDLQDSESQHTEGQRRRQKKEDDADVLAYRLIWERLVCSERKRLDKLEATLRRMNESIVASSRKKDSSICYQPHLNMDTSSRDYLAQLYMMCEEAKPVLDTLLVTIARNVGGGCEAVTCPSLKSEERALEKARISYEGDYSQLKDLIRGSIVASDIQVLLALVGVIGHMIHEGDPRLVVLRLKNRFSRSYKAKGNKIVGYRDVQLIIQVPGHHVYAEVQLHLADVMRVKSHLIDANERNG